jgi:hypothetical protein
LSRDVVFANQISALAAWRRGKHERDEQAVFATKIELHIHHEVLSLYIAQNQRRRPTAKVCEGG